MNSTINHVLLRERRKATNLTIKQLANRLNMFPSQVCDVENGKKQITVAKVLPYCQALGIQPNDLFVWSETSRSN